MCKLFPIMHIVMSGLLFWDTFRQRLIRTPVMVTSSPGLHWSTRLPWQFSRIKYFEDHLEGFWNISWFDCFKRLLNFYFLVVDVNLIFERLVYFVVSTAAHFLLLFWLPWFLFLLFESGLMVLEITLDFHLILKLFFIYASFKIVLIACCFFFLLLLCFRILKEGRKCCKAHIRLLKRFSICIKRIEKF